MKILVCISKTPDTTAKIAFTANNTKFAADGVQWIINPYDEWYALVRALELKEAGLAEAIHLVTVGAADSEPIMRKALALGGEEAIRVNTDNHDSYYIASQIAAVAKDGGYGLILTGKETIDYNGASIGGMIAEILDLPFVSIAAKLDIEGNNAILVREIEGGEETNKVALPLVVSCQKGMAEQRIPNMKGIMSAKTKPLQVISPTNINALVDPVQFRTPAAKSAVHYVDPANMDELVRLRHEEAKVI